MDQNLLTAFCARFYSLKNMDLHLSITQETNVGTAVDDLLRLDIDSLKFQEEDLMTLILGSENNSISNVKFPIHTVSRNQDKEKRA
jgi:hypothetical protein